MLQMIQNNSVNTLLLNPRIMDMPARSVPREANKGDAAFMDFLSEKLQAAKDSNVRRQPLEKSLTGDEKVKLVRQRTDVKTPSPDKAEKVNEGTAEPAKPTVEKVSDENGTEAEGKAKAKDTVAVLESIAVLLQEILPQLDAEPEAEALVENAKPESGLPVLDAKTDPASLLKVLLESGAEKLKAIANKDGQSQEMTEISRLVDKIQDLLGKINKDQGATQGLVEPGSFASAAEVPLVELLDRLKAEMNQVIGKVREKISELGQTLPQNTDVKDDMLKAQDLPGEALLENRGGKVASGSENLEAEEDIPAIEQESEAKSVKPKAATDEKPHSVPKAHEQPSEEVQGHDTGESFSIPSEPKLREAPGIKAEKAPLPLYGKPLSQTVTQQVMMKVRLMTGANRQEMEMHLKPESLGKLSLKVIHERGEILAKITAENEQVKGILEGNMQLLKDALEKSGLQVQSLSVSVGNGNDRNQGGKNLGENSRPQARNTAGSSKASGVSETLYSRPRTNDFYNEGSQINLTA